MKTKLTKAETKLTKAETKLKTTEKKLLLLINPWVVEIDGPRSLVVRLGWC